MGHKAISTSIYVMNTGNYNSLKFISIFPISSSKITDAQTIGLKQQTNLRMESAKLNYTVLVLQILKNKTCAWWTIPGVYEYMNYILIQEYFKL